MCIDVDMICQMHDYAMLMVQIKHDIKYVMTYACVTSRCMSTNKNKSKIKKER